MNRRDSIESKFTICSLERQKGEYNSNFELKGLKDVSKFFDLKSVQVCASVRRV